MPIYRSPCADIAMRLLVECHLPVSDPQAKHFEHFFACGAEQSPDGIVGLELHGSVALLRSLAVSEKTRHQGCGQTLVAEAERYAGQQGVREIYLLTNSAELFFSALGYRCIDRGLAPETIRNTNEFSNLCPVNSTLMMKRHER